MAKVRNATSTPKSKGSQKKVDEEPSTSGVSTTTKTQPQKKTRSNTSKKSTPKTATEQARDSGISSAEEPRQTRQKASLSRVSQKSKSSISKSKKKATIKRLDEITWLHEILHKNSMSGRKCYRTAAGIDVYMPSMLRLKIMHGVEFVEFPMRNCGYVKIEPGQEKRLKKSLIRMKFLVLFGTVGLLAGKKVAEYSCGTLFHIPKGLKYGFQNTSDETCVLRYQTITADETS